MESPDNFEYFAADDGCPSCSDMDSAVAAVEALLRYKFKNRALLEEALTHPSYTDSPSYQRLEFIGDAALGGAVSNYLYLSHQDLDPGQLSLIRSANISTEKLARVAVRHGLYHYVRRHAAALDDKVREFVKAVSEEVDLAIYGGVVKAPKVLADIVESVAAAVYVDCRFDLQYLWVVFRDLLEPIITLEDLRQQPQPVTMLFELCQKQGKQVDIQHWRKGDKDIVSVFVDGKFVTSSSSEQKEIAKLNAAKIALEKLSQSNNVDLGMVESCDEVSGTLTWEIEAAKQKLHVLCVKKKWPKPTYTIEKEIGPGHERQFVCSVKVKVADTMLCSMGISKSRVKDSENSAASFMLSCLQQYGYKVNA
ncbi:ribonuclease 3-like protein 2 [Malania oleifera]|uniref:ribonuclease 3-like protein 2 n=1 Tax=Malania oleifera TaxID=397392 RepID=UPI0025ADF959|nr:ribonuclease 3-like protein 2 [Malania oleifera]